MKMTELEVGMEVAFRSRHKNVVRSYVVLPSCNRIVLHKPGPYVGIARKSTISSSYYPEIVPPGSLIPWAQFVEEQEKEDVAEGIRRKEKNAQYEKDKARSGEILDTLKLLGIEHDLRVNPWGKLEMKFERDLEPLLETLLSRFAHLDPAE